MACSSRAEREMITMKRFNAGDFCVAGLVVLSCFAGVLYQYRPAMSPAPATTVTSDVARDPCRPCAAKFCNQGICDGYKCQVGHCVTSNASSAAGSPCKTCPDDQKCPPETCRENDCELGRCLLSDKSAPATVKSCCAKQKP